MSNKPTVLILKGLPASGKTTFAKELQNKEKGKWKRINHDELRAMLDDGYFEKGMDTQLLKVRNAMLDVYLEDGINVIIDNTNLSTWVLNDLLKYVGDRAHVEIKDFNISVEECVERDAQREKPVGEKVIRSMYKKFLA